MVARAIELLAPRAGRRRSTSSAASAISPCRSRAASRPWTASRAMRRWSRGRARTRSATASRMPSSHAATSRAVGCARGLGAAAYDLVLLDPPRAGAREVLPSSRVAARRSFTCPATPAASRATQAYWCASTATAAAAGIMDMFPHTSHVESIALFTEPAECSAMTLGPVMVDLAGTRSSREDARCCAPAGRQRHPLHAQLREPRAARAAGGGDPRASARRRCSSPWTRRAGACSAFARASRACRRCATSAALYDLDPAAGRQLARQLGWLMAAELRAVGVDMSFAPCVDLDYGVSSVIGDRALHRDPEASPSSRSPTCSACARPAWRRRPSIFPGTAPSSRIRTCLPVDRALADLEADLRPYRRLIGNGLPSVMVAHVVFPEVDGLRQAFPRAGCSGAARRPRLPGGRFCGRPVDGGCGRSATSSRAPRRARSRLRRAAGLQRSPRCAASHRFFAREPEIL